MAAASHGVIGLPSTTAIERLSEDDIRRLVSNESSDSEGTEMPRDPDEMPTCMSKRGWKSMCIFMMAWGIEYSSEEAAAHVDDRAIRFYRNLGERDILHVTVPDEPCFRILAQATRNREYLRIRLIASRHFRNELKECTALCATLEARCELWGKWPRVAVVVVG